MKNNRIIESWNKIEPGNAADARMLGAILTRNRRTGQSKKGKAFTMNKKRTLNWKWLAPVVACLVIAVVIAIPLLSGGGDFNLKQSKGVKVSYTDNPPDIRSEMELVYLTEEELFAPEWHGLEIAAFEGEVVKVDNIVLSFGNEWYHKNYRAIVTIEVSKVYRGDMEAGTTVAVLLPAPVLITGDEVRAEDSSVSSQMTVGTTGIFMPARYNDDSTWEENDRTLYLKEIAEYGFLDGERWAFLETSKGVVFTYAYESISGAKTMDEIRQYVIAMLGD